MYGMMWIWQIQLHLGHVTSKGISHVSSVVSIYVYSLSQDFLSLRNINTPG